MFYQAPVNGSVASAGQHVGSHLKDAHAAEQPTSCSMWGQISRDAHLAAYNWQHVNLKSVAYTSQPTCSSM